MTVVSLAKTHLQEMIDHFELDAHIVLDHLNDEGVQCVGIVHSPTDNPKIGLILIGAMIFIGQSPKQAMISACELSLDARTDVYGMNMITYFPGLEMIDEQTSYNQQFWDIVEAEGFQDDPIFDWPDDDDDQGGTPVEPSKPSPTGSGGATLDLLQEGSDSPTGLGERLVAA